VEVICQSRDGGAGSQRLGGRRVAGVEAAAHDHDVAFQAGGHGRVRRGTHLQDVWPAPGVGHVAFEQGLILELLRSAGMERACHLWIDTGEHPGREARSGPVRRRRHLARSA
jgi:hypothetical protein